MLIRFSSVATESITMFGGVAMLLIKMLGASNALPGAIGAEDIPVAVTRLKRLLREQQHMHAVSVANSVDPHEADANDQLPIALASRASPLIGILLLAATANAPVMWEKA